MVVVMMTVAALVVGAAFALPAALVGQGEPSAAQAEHDPQALARALASFRTSVVHDAYNTGPLRLFELGNQVATFQTELAALDASQPEGSPERDHRTMDDLAAIEQDMVEYMEHGAYGRIADMQRTVWRFLWRENGLPMRIVAPS